jgi:outer membrane receptor protein involved in Fe transport
VANEYIYTDFALTGDFLVQLEHKFGDFSGKMILGNATYMDKYHYLYVGNNSIVIPLLYNISNRLGEPGVDQQQQNRNSVGLFGDLTLGYKEFVFIHASARNDWDSRLTAENRSFFYPGVDGSLVLSDAIPALKNNSVLSFLKLRGSWSQTGQISLTNWYATLPAFNVGGGFPYGSLTGFNLSTALSNPKLKPEKTQEVEAGFEASFMKNRFHLTFNLYQSNTKDQTIPANISYATGYASAYINAGELMSKGIETDLNITPVLNFGDFAWNLTVNYTYNTSEVLSILPGLNELPIQSASYAVVGQQFPAIKVTDVERDPQGRIIVDPVTGYPIKDPALKLLGHGNPNHILGINNTFTFKGFTLNAVADYRSGSVIVNAIGGALDFTGSSWHSAQNGRQDFVIPNSVINTGTADNPVYVPNTNVVTRSAGRNFWVYSDYAAVQSPFVTSAAFWKLRELSLTYDVPVQKLFGGRFVKDAQVGFVGRNLFMLRPKTNTWTDPEFNNVNGNINAVGYTTEYQTPATRIMGFSIKLTF